MQKYKAAYSAIGEERIQQVPKTFDDDEIPTSSQERRMFQNAEEAFWTTRKDRNWAEIPGYMKFVRRTRKKEFFEGVSQILLHLEPSVAFNPAELWRKEREREKENEAKQLEAVETVETKKKGKQPVKKIDALREANIMSSDAQRFNKEVAKIRNSKANLMSIVREIKYPDARAILLLQILKLAFEEYTTTKSKKLLFEVYWAIQELTLPEVPAPAVDRKQISSSVKDPSLVYDSLSDVKSLLKKVKKVIDDESDVIRLQLLEMSDVLPPLSRFSHGFRLDEWQKRVLTWIDGGKSVVICAPTSSGKTVLSSYVAMIFKSHIEDSTDEAPATKAAAPAKAVATIKIDGEDVEFADDDEEDEMEEEEEEGEDEVDVSQIDLGKVDPAAAAEVPTDESQQEEQLMCAEDRAKRMAFLAQKQALHQRGEKGTGQKVLFVVPTEPLVWQVAAYFTKLMKEEGDKHTVVGIVTDQMTFSPMKSINSMPQIVVGTPKALESALTKPRGLSGQQETKKHAAGNILAGGFDHFDWAIYDEVHALDGEEGGALQRIIRSMSCPFLALSATIGNAEQLRNWMALVKQQQLGDVQVLDLVNPSAGAGSTAAAAVAVAAGVPKKESLEYSPAKFDSSFKSLPAVTFGGEAAKNEYTIWNTVSGEVLTISVPEKLTVQQLKLKLNETWKYFMVDSAKAIEQERPYLQLFEFGGAGRDELPGDKLLSSCSQKNLILSSEFRISLVNMSTGKNWSTSIASKDATEMWVKKKICELSNEANIEPVLCIFRGVEICSKSSVEHNQFLHMHQLFAPQVKDTERVIYFRFFNVHDCVGGTGRFINLQRYLWTPKNTRSDKLSPLSPLAAVPNAQALADGILENSSLSFTSKDSFKVWEELSKIFPAEVVAFVSPYNFFSATTRITLQQTKEYEDLLKKGLQQLAKDYPAKIDQLLKVFVVEDQIREFDLVDLLLDLRKKDLLPALPFHLNTFEAIKLFQHVVAGIEYRQKMDQPNYYSKLIAENEEKQRFQQSQIKNTGRNEKELEEQKRSGDIDSIAVSNVDEHAPDMRYTFCKGSPLAKHELETLIMEMERNDGFEKRDTAGLPPGQRGENIAILNHALIRGLRRGIGLFVDEVSFPSYRRIVQKLASVGRLGVVISDGSLAFGVNMPFRTTIFCGEMQGQLDELMAQQMSGRAGRRGLDTQGNIIYAGLRMPLMRRLMIGTVSNITGQHYYPKYESLFLQAILSPRHTGFNRAAVIGGISLQEYVQQHSINNHAHNTNEVLSPVERKTGYGNAGSLPERLRGHGAVHSIGNMAAYQDPHYTFSVSRQAMIDLGFITPDCKPNHEKNFTHAILALIWELRDSMPHSITVGQLFQELVKEFPIVNQISLNSEKQKMLELMEPHIGTFFCILIQLIDRTPFSSHHEDIKLLEDPYFHQSNRLEIFEKWEKLFADQQANLPEHLAHLRNPVPAGTELDGTFFRCCIDRNYIHTLSDTKKQEMKLKIWHIGNVIKILNNCAVLEEEYVRCAFFVFRNAFEKLRFLNSELIRSMINLENITEYQREKRGEKAEDVVRLPQAEAWSDLDTSSWSDAIEHIVKIASDLKGTFHTQESQAELAQMVDHYLTILPQDMEFIQVVIDYNNPPNAAHIKSMVAALGKVSFANLSNISSNDRMLLRIGVLIWFVTVLQPTASAKFRFYMQAMYDAELLTDEVIISWYKMNFDSVLTHLPTSFSGHNVVLGNPKYLKMLRNKIHEDDVTRLQGLCKDFVDWLQQEDDDDDEDEEDDDDE